MTDGSVGQDIVEMYGEEEEEEEEGSNELVVLDPSHVSLMYTVHLHVHYVCA